MPAVQTIVSVPFDHVQDPGSGYSLIAADPAYSFHVMEFLITGDGTGRVKIMSGGILLTALEVTAGGGGIKTLSYPLQGGLNQILKLVITGSINVSGHIIVKKVPAPLIS